MADAPDLNKLTRDLRRTIRHNQRVRAIRQAAKQIASCLRQLQRLKK